MARPKAKAVPRPAHKAPARAPEANGKPAGGKQFDDSNRGVLFDNDRKEKDTHPDYTGNLTVKIPEGAKPGDEIKFWLSAWNKHSEKSGKDFLSLSIKEKEQQ